VGEQEWCEVGEFGISMIKTLVDIDCRYNLETSRSRVSPARFTMDKFGS
jgi:hypothetical protein